jgi:hypothetical protein
MQGTFYAVDGIGVRSAPGADRAPASDSLPALARPATLGMPALVGWLARLAGRVGANKVKGPFRCRPDRSW